MKHRRMFGSTSRAPVLRAATENEAEILIFDEIGFFGVEAREVRRVLSGITADTIHVRVNSPGGDVFDGLAIFNALREHRARIVVHVDGLAASIASVIAMAGDEIRMAENAFLMIHNPFTFAIGDADEMRRTAEVLDKITSTLVDTYVAATGAGADAVAEWMDAETWFTAAEAKKEGFAHVVEGETAVKNTFDLSIFTRPPATLVAAAHEPTPRDLERALRDAGLSRERAKAVLSAGLRPEQEDDPDPRQRDAARDVEAIRQCAARLSPTAGVT